MKSLGGIDITVRGDGTLLYGYGWGIGAIEKEQRRFVGFAVVNSDWIVCRKRVDSTTPSLDEQSQIQLPPKTNSSCTL